MTPDYTSFQTEDFVLDESFQSFVAGTNNAAVQFWKNWLATHPVQRPTAEKAQRLVQALGQAWQPVVAAELKEQDLRRLYRAIQPSPVVPRLRVQRRTRQLVGVLLLVLAVGTGYWLWPVQRGLQAQYATQAGQQRTVRLPDGSVVVLNGNSRLTTAATWDTQATREVWLEGEGYFQVSHLAQQPGLAIGQAAGNAKFVVHAGDLDVSVLGTKFNVINRLGVPSKVTLNDGKVLAENGNLFNHNEVLMKPGDLVEYAPAARELAKRTVEATYYSAWVTGNVKFDRTPLSEIIQLLKDTYGLQVTVDDPRMLHQTITGSLPNTNADVLLDALAKSLGMRSERTGQQVRFRTI